MIKSSKYLKTYHIEHATPIQVFKKIGFKLFSKNKELYLIFENKESKVRAKINTTYNKDYKYITDLTFDLSKDKMFHFLKIIYDQTDIRFITQKSHNQLQTNKLFIINVDDYLDELNETYFEEMKKFSLILKYFQYFYFNINDF